MGDKGFVGGAFRRCFALARRDCARRRFRQQSVREGPARDNQGAAGRNPQVVRYRPRWPLERHQARATAMHLRFAARARGFLLRGGEV